jgi:flagellar basal body rod protein FlgC
MNRQIIAALVGISVVFLAQAEDYRHVKTVKGNKQSINRSYNFKAVSVEGYIDNPGFIDINGVKEMADMGVTLNRSFTENLKENIDKETVQRMSGQVIK